MTDNPVGQTRTTAQHTPGPWRISAHNEVFVTLPEGDYGIADCDIDSAISGGEVEANARLIAAAPDLLNIAKFVVESDFQSFDPITIQQFQDIIARAEGRQP